MNKTASTWWIPLSASQGERSRGTSIRCKRDVPCAVTGEIEDPSSSRVKHDDAASLQVSVSYAAFRFTLDSDGIIEVTSRSAGAPSEPHRILDTRSNDASTNGMERPPSG